MTAHELAGKLNGREIGYEITKIEEAQAKEAGLVVMFGASDDLVELRGMIDDELDALDGRTVKVTAKGLLPEWNRDMSEEDAEAYFEQKRGGVVEIKALWCPGEPDCSWAFQTDLPHATFDVMEDGQLYCRGIVFSVEEIFKRLSR